MGKSTKGAYMTDEMKEFLDCEMGKKVLDWFNNRLLERQDEMEEQLHQGYEEAWQVIQMQKEKINELKGRLSKC